MNVDGEEWIKCVASYDSDGKRYCFFFYATSLDHAAVVLQDIKETAVLDGTNVEEIRK